MKLGITAAAVGQSFFNTRLAGSIVKSRIIAAVVGQVFFFITRLAGGIVKSRIIAAVAYQFFCLLPG